MKSLSVLLLLASSALAVNREANSPVYSPNAKPSYSVSTSNSDHQASASNTNYQTAPAGSGGSSGASYYYFYPPADDKKQTGTYQAASSNQYTSAVNPNQADRNAVHGGMEPAGASSDLSYSQEMGNYQGASGINEAHYGAEGGSNYGGSGLSLSNIAAQYGLGGGQSGGSFNPASFPSSSGGPGYPTANSYEAAASQNYPGAAAAGEGYPQNGPSFGGQGGPMYVPQDVRFQGYGGQHFGNFPSGSNQSPTYEAPATGLRKYGLGSIIMPMLALAGLSLLIPTVTSLTGLSAASSAASSRRKRSADEQDEAGIGGYIDRLDRYYTLYKTAVENEDCMNRIICQLGDAVKDVRGKNTFFTVLEKVAPNWMNGKVGIFKKGALSEECASKYKC